MRTLTFDQWEFDPPDGEEGLEISIAAKNDFLYPNVEAFADAVYGTKSDGKLPTPVPFTEGLGRECPNVPGAVCGIKSPDSVRLAYARHLE